MARDKELAAAKMREKQAAGTNHTTHTHTRRTPGMGFLAFHKQETDQL